VTVLVEAIRKKPAKALPVLIQRMKSKDEEWREARRGFLKTWREQNEKYHYKAMDHQGINFKQTDSKKLRSKALLSEIETLYDNRIESAEKEGKEPSIGPHLSLSYADKQILDDAAMLLIHYARRQTATPAHREERNKLLKLIHNFLPSLYFHQSGLIGAEEELEEEEGEEAAKSDNNSKGSSTPNHFNKRKNGNNKTSDVDKDSGVVKLDAAVTGGKNGVKTAADKLASLKVEDPANIDPKNCPVNCDENAKSVKVNY
jgi:paired amphipathic helix protein Sin3a